MIRSNIIDGNTKFPSVFRLRHENSQMPCKALLCVGPAKLGNAVHSSLPLRLFQGRTPTLSWCLIPSSLSILTDRQTKTTPSPWTSWARDSCVCTEALTMCPRLSGKAPLGHRVCLCPLYSLRAESLPRSFLYCQSRALFLTQGKIPNWPWAKVIHLQDEPHFTGRTVWYLTALFLTTLSGSKRCTLVCSGGHEMGHTCFMFSKPLLDNAPCDVLLDG